MSSFMENVSSEEVVVRWVEEVSKAPKDLRPLVNAYRRRAKVADACTSYPQHVDDEMNKLFDAMVVMAGEVQQ